MFVLEERGKAECRNKNLSEQGRQVTTNLTHVLRRDLNPASKWIRPREIRCLLVVMFLVVSVRYSMDVSGFPEHVYVLAKSCEES